MKKSTPLESKLKTNVITIAGEKTMLRNSKNLIQTIMLIMAFFMITLGAGNSVEAAERSATSMSSKQIRAYCKTKSQKRKSKKSQRKSYKRCVKKLKRDQRKKDKQKNKDRRSSRRADISTKELVKKCRRTADRKKARKKQRSAYDKCLKKYIAYYQDDSRRWAEVDRAFRDTGTVYSCAKVAADLMTGRGALKKVAKTRSSYVSSLIATTGYKFGLKLHEESDRKCENRIIDYVKKRTNKCNRYMRKHNVNITNERGYYNVYNKYGKTTKRLPDYCL